MPQVVDSRSEGREAARRHAWYAAYDAYAAAPADDLTPDDLELYADAAWWTGKIEEAIALRERAYAGFTAAGDRLRAAGIALALQWDHSGRKAFAVANGWFSSAERLLADEPESPAHGFLELTRGVNALFAGSIDDALASLEQAVELGRRFGDRDVEMIARTATGRALIKSGEVERGLELLDESTASAVCGELRPYSTGLVYCITISSCQDLGDYRRAAEWTEEANRWCDRLEVSGFPGACRLHRAEAMRLRGDWAGAERQAQAACDELQDFERVISGGGYHEIGEIRRRQGNFAGAEEAYARANELGREPQPGLALLRLAQGKVDAAATSIRRSLADWPDDPLLRVRHLPAQVEIAVAAGDLPTAHQAADELDSIIDAYKIGGRRAPAFDATLHLARGRIALAEGDAAGAAALLRRSRDEWQEVGAPYETAQARLALGIAFRREGDEHAATAELEAALATFERLGAKLDEAQCRDLLGKLEARRTFLFTDIVGSTELLGTLGEEKWKRLLQRHNELVRERIVAGGGEVIKNTGDGFFASFDDPKSAVEAAIAIQRALDDEIVAPDVRIGAHSGGAFRTGEGYADYAGEGVHVAARIGAAAGAAEILVSRETLDGVGSAFRVSDPRSEQLKGFEEPVEVVSIDWR